MKSSSKKTIDLTQTMIKMGNTCYVGKKPDTEEDEELLRMPVDVDGPDTFKEQIIRSPTKVI